MRAFVMHCVSGGSVDVLEPLKQQLHFLFLQPPVVPLCLSAPHLLPLSVSWPLIPVSVAPSASLSEYGPHRLPISLVCRRLQRLLRLADPPGQGQRAAAPSTSERQSQRGATPAAAAATAAPNQPLTGYPSLWAFRACSYPRQVLPLSPIM